MLFDKLQNCDLALSSQLNIHEYSNGASRRPYELDTKFTKKKCALTHTRCACKQTPVALCEKCTHL